MFILFRQYGSIVEITEYEKKPNPKRKVGQQNRVSFTYTGLPRYRSRRFDSIVRAKQICLRRVSCAIAKFGSPLFITLTFEGSSSEIGLANKALTSFQWRLRSKYSNSVSLFVPELSPKGRIHFHGLIFGLPLSFGDKRVGGRVVSVGSERRSRIIAKLWACGFVDVRATDGSSKLASYVSKYITKSGQNPLFDRIRLIRVSRGFPKEWVSTGDFAEFLSDKYKPFRESHLWVGQNTWCGRIRKRIYYTDKKFVKKINNVLPLDTIF